MNFVSDRTKNLQESLDFLLVEKEDSYVLILTRYMEVPRNTCVASFRMPTDRNERKTDT